MNRYFIKVHMTNKYMKKLFDTVFVLHQIEIVTSSV